MQSIYLIGQIVQCDMFKVKTGIKAKWENRSW